MSKTLIDQRVIVTKGTPDRRVATWKTALGATGRVEIDPMLAKSFEGRMRSREVGPMMIVHVQSDTFRYLRDEAAAKRVGRDHVFVNYVERGTFSGHLNGRRVAVVLAACTSHGSAAPRT